MSRAAVAASAVVVLGLAAACGGSDGGTGKDDKGAAKPAADKGSSAPAQDKGAADKGAAGKGAAGKGAAEKAAPALTAAQLEKALVSGGDVEGLQFERLSEKDYSKADEAGDVGECAPLVDMVAFTTDPEPKARVAAGGMDAKFSSVSSVALFGHEQADAEKVLGGVREAVDACETFEAQDAGYSGIASLPDPKKGDESVAYKLRGESEGEGGDVAFTVVRSGSTVLTFFTANVSGGGKVEVPAALVDAQLAKLEKSTG